MYINGWKKLAVGKARYGLMLREDGYVFDDGTTSRLTEDHYFMTTTTANAAPVLAHLEHASQVLWPDLDVHFCSATEQWCGVAVAGPNARKVLADAFGDSIDLSSAALPFMGVREFDWKNARSRIFRISFSGELAYEVNVPWRFGEAMWNTLYSAGLPHGLIPYGTEALGVLRIEKGHVAGNELDGRSTATDMGLGRMMSTKKHYIGLPMSQREGMTDPDRPGLVGLKRVGDEGRLRGGAHLFADPDDARTETSLGWVTSVADSPAAGTWIGLGYLTGRAWAARASGCMPRTRSRRNRCKWKCAIPCSFRSGRRAVAWLTTPRNSNQSRRWTEQRNCPDPVKSICRWCPA